MIKPYVWTQTSAVWKSFCCWVQALQYLSKPAPVEHGAVPILEKLDKGKWPLILEAYIQRLHKDHRSLPKVHFGTGLGLDLDFSSYWCKVWEKVFFAFYFLFFEHLTLRGNNYRRSTCLLLNTAFFPLCPSDILMTCFAVVFTGSIYWRGILCTILTFEQHSSVFCHVFML